MVSNAHRHQPERLLDGRQKNFADAERRHIPVGDMHQSSSSYEDRKRQLREQRELDYKEWKEGNRLLQKVTASTAYSS